MCAQSICGGPWAQWRAVCLALALAGFASASPALDRQLTLTQLDHKAWSTRDGAPAEVDAFAQTADGLLWLGSPTGISRFDGLKFEAFRPPEGESGPTASVSTLFASPRTSGLWIGYRFGGVGWWHAGHLQHFLPGQDLPRGTVLAFAASGDGTVWAGTTTGLAHFDGHHWTTVPQSGYCTGATYALLFDPDDTLWALAEDGTWRLPSGAASFERAAQTRSEGALAARSDGRIWVANGSQGVWALGGADTPPARRVKVPGPGAVGPLLFDRDGALWIGAHDGLMRVTDPDRLPPPDHEGAPSVAASARYTRAEGLSGNGVLGLFEDREGDVWVSTSDGIDRFRMDKLQRPALPPGLLYPSLAPARGGGVWVASTVVSPVRVAAHPLSLPHVGPRITSVLRDAHGDVWMAGALGLWRVSGDSAQRVPLPPALSGLPVQAMAEAPGGRLRLAAVGHGQWQQDEPPSQGWHPLPEPPGGPDPNPLAMLADGRGQMWLGYAFGRLVRVDASGAARTWRRGEGLNVGSILCLTLQDERLWIGGELGVAVMVEDRLHALTFAQTPAVTGVSGIVTDRAGNLWLNAAQGVVRVPATEVTAALAHPRHLISGEERLDYLDGIQGAPAQLRPLPTALMDDDGWLWFATNAGVVRIDPAHIHRNPLAPIPQLLSLEAAGKQRPLNTDPGSREPSITLPYRTREVTLQYTAGALSLPEKVRFRVRLAGVDKDWQEAGGGRRAHYTNLGPGSYLFEVLAANEDGLWSSAPARLAFSVPPTFYQRSWFPLLLAAPALLVAWLLVQWRLRVHDEHYAARHQAIVYERERIARDLHDTLLQGMQGLILHIQSTIDGLPAGVPSRPRLEKSLDRAEQMLAEGRQQLTGLRGSCSQDTDVAQLLRRSGEELAQACHVEFCMQERGEASALPAHVREELVRIGREALLNAFRHAGGTRVSLSITHHSQGVQLLVEDNGRGLPAAAAVSTGSAMLPGHWGLIGMRERALVIGARLSITSEPGLGTRVRLDLPGRSRLGDLLAAWRRRHGATFEATVR